MSLVEVGHRRAAFCDRLRQIADEYEKELGAEPLGFDLIVQSENSMSYRHCFHEVGFNYVAQIGLLHCCIDRHLNVIKGG